MKYSHLHNDDKPLFDLSGEDSKKMKQMRQSGQLAKFDLVAETLPVIGFWGYPDPKVIKKYKSLYPQAQWVDLDIDFKYPSAKILPEAYCKIIKNIFDNAFHLRKQLVKIIAPIGKDKCDSAFFAAQILKEQGFDVETTIFENITNKKETPVCKSNLPLKEKFERLTGNIIENEPIETTECTPRFGFWGVPPNDLGILELFPNDTHAYGWIRCVEAGVPADLELEMFVDTNVPTVFFAQTFCAKNQLAKYLANKHNGLYVDIDGYANNSVKAKLEAFLKLR